MARPLKQPDVLTGTIYAGGTLIGVHHRDLRWHAVATCHCGKTYQCRLDWLIKGKQRSCSCLEKAAYVAYHTRGADWIPAARRLQIAEDAEMHGSAYVASKYKLHPTRVNIIWKSERLKAVTGFASTSLDKAITIAVARGYSAAVAATKIAHWIILAASRMRAAVSKAMATASAIVDAATKASLKIAKSAEVKVLDSLERGWGFLLALDSDPDRRRKGEFDAWELPPPSRGKGPVRKILDILYAALDLIPATLDWIRINLQSAVEYTIACREDRRKTVATRHAISRSSDRLSQLRVA